MSGGMYLAASGAMVQQLRLEVIANNVANINTVGYKGEKTVFRFETQPQSGAAPNSDTTDSVQALSPYAPPFYTVVDFSQGALRQTNNPLDVAISGGGLFSVQTPDGVQYTRQGSFSLDSNGVLVTEDGNPVLGESGPITIDGGRVEIDMEGSVMVDGDEVGRLRLTEFDGAGALKKTGNGRFAPADQTIQGRTAEGATINQGYLEMANVNPVQAMTEMIETSRAFEAYQKVIQSADEATSKSISDVGRTT